MKVTTTDTAGSPAKPRRRAQRRPDPVLTKECWDSILFHDETPDRVEDICRVVTDKFHPASEYDHYLATISAANTYLYERFMSYGQRLIETKVLNQAALVESQFQQLDTCDRAALTFRDSDFIQSMRFLRDSETVCLRRAFLVNNELRKPAIKS